MLPTELTPEERAGIDTPVLDPKLDQLVDEFAAEMKARLLVKQNEGLTGYNTAGNGALLEALDKAVKTLFRGYENEIDCANWLLFIYNIHKNK